MENKKIAVVGLGYVGLPLAVEFGKKFDTIGFDINEKRVNELRNNIDKTLETTSDDLKSAKKLTYTCDINDLKGYKYYIVTVPTPIDKNKRPDLTPLENASAAVGTVLGKGAIVIYESTVFPGATEDICVPILEQESGLTFNKDFFCGYSPERINPGDKVHTVTKIKKVTSGSTPEIGKEVDDLYNTVITAGTHLASSMKVAEAAKVIENAQRDLNIAFVNELAKIFNIMNINTIDVLEAAGTKWNFLPFRPGLVGGHCIGVDPYYLTFKAQEIGYHPEVILAGRRINDSMGAYVAQEAVKLMITKGHKVKDSKVLVMGITFKENCPDIRNSRVIDVVREFEEFGCEVDVHDPWADHEEVRDEYGIDLITSKEDLLARKNSFAIHQGYDCIFLAVKHDEFLEYNIEELKNGNTAIFDAKGIIEDADQQL
ncbi:MAG: nucleotide sugar dehydrogenase [Fidelibacterota bacterium]